MSAYTLEAASALFAKVEVMRTERALAFNEFAMQELGSIGWGVNDSSEVAGNVAQGCFEATDSRDEQWALFEKLLNEFESAI